MNKRLYTAILIIVLIIGLSLMLYPTISFRWNALHQSRAIANYVDELQYIDDNTHVLMWDSAVEYNKKLLKEGNGTIALTDELRDDYNATLNIGDSGIMGYIEIPSISCFLPIYHGTQDDVLQIAVGHIEGSTLPVGGASTHCVLSGHRGLPSARLFTDLDKLSEGDRFTLNILKTILTYEVYEILTVLPYELDELKVEENQDLCTLVTCTPYGVNSHRLLVKARRVPNEEQQPEVRVVAEAMQIDPIIVASFIAIPILFILLMFLLFKPNKSRM